VAGERCKYSVQAVRAVEGICGAKLLVCGRGLTDSAKSLVSNARLQPTVLPVL
jgi:hypothetical protein